MCFSLAFWVVTSLLQFQAETNELQWLKQRAALFVLA
jgi:hypothetical protein